jgi:Raf kinase inhibitor-like YbhB/YbcL family protein
VIVAAVLAAAFALASPAFRPGGTIPRVYTCDGRNVSPPLTWRSPPRGTTGFAILMDDPDAPSGAFTHWLAWSIPANARSLRAGTRPAREGTNDAGGTGYTGPCPPSGTHRYVFRVYALKRPLQLPRGASRAQFVDALRRKVLAVTRLTGRYHRS